jgi:hypothetical protein
MNDDQDTFTQTAFGKAALKKLAPLSANFRLYRAEWLGKKPEDWHEMRLTGRVFRAPKSGPDKGKLNIPVAGTIRSVVVSRTEVQAT